MERTQINRQPAFTDAPFIAPGDQAAQLVRWLYFQVEDGVPSTAEQDFRRLSCELNVAEWDYHTRRVGCNDIVGACLAHLQQIKRGTVMSARDTAIRDGLLSFRRNRSLAPLLDTLSRN